MNSVPPDPSLRERLSTAWRDRAVALKAVSFAVVGLINTAVDARAQQAVPVGLLEGGKVIAPVKKGELLTRANAAPDPTTRLFALRKQQDEMLGYA